ncbi:MAG: helix-turn-helix transcriptional regulator [Acidobacteria bacterium]|jgi:DNA-binding CsgD family transcriptional regulator|nr:helix-turn-helix transcriptional regulator [Acidobacteriota bacterium]
MAGTASFWLEQAAACVLVAATLLVSFRLHALYQRAYLRDWFFFVLSLDLVLYILHLLQRVAPAPLPGQANARLLLTALLVRPLAWIGLVLFARFVLSLLGSQAASWMRAAAFLYLGLQALAVIVTLLLAAAPWPVLGTVSDMLVMAGLYAMTALVLWRTNRGEREELRPALRNLAAVFFLSQTVFLFFPFERWRSLAGMALLLLPILTLWRSQHRLFRSGMPAVAEAGAVEAFFDRKGVTAREREIAWLISAGRDNLAASDELFISVATVKHHVTSLYRKLEVKNRVQLNNLIQQLGGKPGEEKSPGSDSREKGAAPCGPRRP